MRATPRRCASPARTQRPFDLSSGPLLRTVLLTLDSGRHLLGSTAHHIIFDGGRCASSFRSSPRSMALMRQVSRRRCRTCRCSMPTMPSGSESSCRGTCWGRYSQLGATAAKPSGARTAHRLPEAEHLTFRGAYLPVEFVATLVGRLRDARETRRGHAVHADARRVRGDSASLH